MNSVHESFAEVLSRWDAIFDPNMRAALERVLPSYIAARRWYRTKTKRVQRARIVAAFPLAYAGATTHEIDQVARIALVELELEDETRATYVLPLCFAGGEEAARLRTRRPHAVVLPLRVASSEGLRLRERPPSEGFIVDALMREDFLAALLGLIARGDAIEDSGLVLRFHPLPPVQGPGRTTRRTTDRPEGAPIRPRLLDREQTNTSVLFADRFVGKVVRKVEPGESPDLELGRFLTEAGYAYAPPLAGWIDVQRADDPSAEPSTIGLLHIFVPNRGDAWRHALHVLEGWLGALPDPTAAPPELASADLLTNATSPLPPDALAVAGDYPRLAELLGRRVGEMHLALASRSDLEAFAPEPLDLATREKVASNVRAELERAITHMGVHSAELPDSARDALAGVRSHLRALEGRLGEAARSAEGGVRIRVHGDVHLGQVLFTGTDFVLIDFEGEPARSLVERRAKRSPVVDVAGMLRSFHYAIASVLRAHPAELRDALGPWASLWYRVVSAAFLRGWLGAVEGSVLLPSDPLATRALLDLFLLEKCVYEVGYELNNRPDWVEIPLEGLRDLMTSAPPAIGRTASRSEAPQLDPRSPALQAFAQGTATHAHSLLGAHVREDGVTDFAVWAPHASRVAVIGDFNAWSGDTHPLARVGGTGIFAGRVREARAGQRYKYRLWSGSSPEPRDKADPFGFMTEVPPATASIVTPLDHAWRDEAWMRGRIDHARLDRPISIYEVHLGSWRRPNEGAGPPLSYREIAAPLAAHAKQMGFTHVELMPLLEHPFYGSWGYGVTGFFAATSRYGTPADLMFLVDTLHQAGLGVIFDWVPAHFARDEHGLAAFDGGPTFEPADSSRAVHPTWNTALFDFARPEVRSFLLSSATFWIEQFHADGLRIDGVESMLYRDHGRAPGTWTPNERGGREDLAGIAFLRELTSTLKLEHPEVLLAAEDSSAWPGVTRAQARGGLGFDLKWDMGFAHDMRRYLATDPIERAHLQGKLTFRSVYAAKEAFVLSLSHDDVVEERGGSLLEQMHGDRWQKLANLRLLYATAWAQPGKKLVFMGDEWADSRPWHHDRGLDWSLVRDPSHGAIARMVGDLNRVYRETPALHLGDASPSGFEWIDGSNAAMSVIAFLRKGAGDDAVVVACNFTPVPRHQYRIGVPRGGRYREIFNSDATVYGGSGHGNLGGVDAVPYPWNNRPSSIMVTLPPLGAVFLARTSA